MLEDRLLVWKCGRGSSAALESIYKKYKDDMLRFGFVLSNDEAVAQDAVHDVFVAFAGHARKLRLRSSLKGYLLSCVANRLRNLARQGALRFVRIDGAEDFGSNQSGPDRLAMVAEEADRIEWAIQQLPCEQREVVVLHIHSGMKFREIAQVSGVSLSTIQSRYAYGLDKLRSALDGEVER